MRPDDQVRVLAITDHGTLTDDEGRMHSAFMENRRFVTLSIPKTIELPGAGDVVEQLVEVLAEAMERKL